MINRAENVLEANIEERSSATGSKSVKEYLVEQSHTPACGDDDGVCKERKCCHTGQFMVVRKDANIMMPRHARSRRSCAAATADRTNPRVARDGNSENRNTQVLPLLPSSRL